MRAVGVVDGRVGRDAEHFLGRGVDRSRRSRRRVGGHQLAVDQAAALRARSSPCAPSRPSGRRLRYARIALSPRACGILAEGGRDGRARRTGQRSPTSAPSSTRGSTRTRDELAPQLRAAGNARRADRADAAREVDPVRRGLDAVRLARARRRARRLADAAHRARRGARGARPRRPRPLLAHRGARADAHRLRAARARGRGRPAPALGRGDVVPGLLGAGHRQRPRVAGLPGGARRRRRDRDRRGSINGQKVWTSLAQYSDRCVLLDAHRHRRVAPPRHHRVLRRHGHARASRSRRSR